MNYLKYYILASLLVCTVGPAGTGSESERVQRLFNIMQTSMAECPKEEMRRFIILSLSFTLLARDPAQLCSSGEESGSLDERKDQY